MAIDEAVAVTFANGITRPTVRLYQWESPTLTLGAFQKSDPTLSQFLETYPVIPIRRITGGQAFLHDRDLTYSIIASTHDPLFSGGIKKTFYSIAQGLLGGLARLGVHADIYTPMHDSTLLREKSPFCAASLSWYEIAVSGKKLIGSAQKRWVNHFLQHGSLPLEQSSFEESLYNIRSITLPDLLNRRPSLAEITDALQIGFESAWSIKLERGCLTSEEIKLADDLLTQKYQPTHF